MTNISWKDDRINTTMMYTINQSPVMNHILTKKHQHRYTNLNIHNLDYHRRSHYYSTTTTIPYLWKSSNNMITRSSPINHTYYSYDNHHFYEEKMYKCRSYSHQQQQQQEQNKPQHIPLTTSSSPPDILVQRPAQMLPPGYKYQSRGGTNNNKNTAGNTTMLSSSSKKIGGTHIIVKAGIPFILFTILSSWVVSKALDGKLKERDVSQGKASMSIRQASLEKEHDDMIEKLNKIIATDFDNTKRIKRPEEILEERRLERINRNKWYNRLYRSIIG